MSANVEIMANGLGSIAYAGATPWHGLGQEITGEMGYSWAACAEVAGLNTVAEKVALKTHDGQDVPDCFAIRRTSDGKIISGSKTVGKTYTILQNSEVGDWFTPFLESKQAQIHTLGSLANGSRIWGLAKLNLDPMEIVPNDPVDKFVLLSHAHDGTLAVRAGFTPIRVVCSNTLAAAHSSAASKLIRIRHGRDVVQNLENVREVMNLANQEFEATAEQYRRLANKQINTNDLVKYVKTVLKVKEGEEISTRTKNIIEEIMGLCESGRGQDIPGVRGTLWSAFNGVTEYLNYNRGHNAETRLNSLFFGQSKVANDYALETALAMAV